MSDSAQTTFPAAKHSQNTVADITSLRSEYLASIVPSASGFEPVGGPIWIFLHGWGANANTWQQFVPLVCPNSEAWLIDLPGFGENTRDVAHLDQLIEELISILPERSVLVGWSLGGMLLPLLDEAVGKRAASTKSYKKIDYCISLAANLKFVQSSEYETAMPEETFETFCEGFRLKPAATWSRFGLLQAQGDENRKYVSGQLKRLHCSPSEEQATAWQRALGWLGQIDNRERLNRATAPFLHVFGAEDALVPKSVAPACIQNYPQHIVRVLDSIGHVVHLSCPETLANVINENVVFCTREASRRSKVRVADSFSRAASQYDATAHLQKTLAHTLVNLVSANAEVVADLGCGTGYCGQGLQAKIPTVKQLVSLDLAEGMLAEAKSKSSLTASTPFAGVCADIESLPFANEGFDTLVSGMSMQWSEDLPALFAEAFRVLRSGGEFVFSTLGPNTLQELRGAWSKADSIQNQKEWVHVNRFIALDVVQNCARNAGFVLQESLKESHVLEYDNVMTLMRELKAIGAHNVNPGREQGLTGKQRFKAMASAYEQYRTPNGRLPLTYEVGFFRFKK